MIHGLGFLNPNFWKWFVGPGEQLVLGHMLFSENIAMMSSLLLFLPFCVCAFLRACLPADLPNVCHARSQAQFT